MGVEFWKRGRLQQAFDDCDELLASCTELARAWGVKEEPCKTLETARHFLLTTARENAGEGGFSMRSAARRDCRGAVAAGDPPQAEAA